MISFTGSTDIGRAFLRYSSESNLKRIVLECGGKNPCVVLEDAADLDLAADQVLNAAFWNMGENCSANSRLIVHESVREALVERILARAREWRTGDPLDPANHLGAMIDQGQYDKVCEYIETAKAEGAKAILEGGPEKGAEGLFIRPTIFGDVDPGAIDEAVDHCLDEIHGRIAEGVGDRYFSYYAPFLGVSPLFDPLRDSPSFQLSLRRLAQNGLAPVEPTRILAMQRD